MPSSSSAPSRRRGAISRQSGPITSRKNGQGGGGGKGGKQLEQKKRKMRQMVAIYRKDKSVDSPASEMDTKSESSGRRKCKNPNCRCRERKRKSKKRRKMRKCEEVVEKREEKEEGMNGREEPEEEEEAAAQLDSDEKIGTAGEGWKEVDEEQRRKAKSALKFCFSEIKINLFMEWFGSHILVTNPQNKDEICKRLPKLDKLDDDGLAKVAQKRMHLEKGYKLNCTTVGLVARKLLLKDPILQESLKPPLLAVMDDFEQEIWTEMDEFIDGIITG